MATTPRRVDGVDISHHQNGRLDMAGAKKRGLKWVYHKATEGVTFKDSNYTKRRAEAKKAGITFGAYHFARPNGGAADAVAEAKFFLSVARPVPGDLRPALDLEVDTGMSQSGLRTWATAFIDEVVRQTGHRPVVYTPYDLGPADDGSIVWRPRYNNSNTPPVLKWDIWQFSNGVFGVPNSVAGVGHVDLNTMREGLTVQDMLIPIKKPTTPAKKKKARLKFAHMSCQFSDTAKEREADIRKVFARGYDILTGTEAGVGAGHGVNSTAELLKKIGGEAGYVVHVPGRYDTWVAVKKTLVVGKPVTGAIHAIDRSSMQKPTPPGRWGDKGVVFIEWNMGKTFGSFAVGAVHNLTWGGAGKDLKEKTDIVYAQKMEEWRKSLPAAVEAFIGGDFNRNDKTGDVFRGKAGFITAGDEHKDWENTGHGPIDGIAREKTSTRTKCVRFDVLDDSELPLATDHFLLEADYEVTAL